MQTYLADTKSGLKNQDINITGLTTAGREWLKASLDPFHDTPVRVEGMPDSDNTPSICQVIKKSVQVSAPAGTVGNWGFSLFTLPEMQGVSTYPVSMRSGAYQPRYNSGAAWVNWGTTQGDTVLSAVNTATQTSVGFLNLWSWTTDVPSSGAVFPNGTSAYVEPAAAQKIDCSPTGTIVGSLYPTASARCRVIAAGFELHNTTAELYKQGMITVSRTPNNNRVGSLATIRELNANTLLIGTGNRVCNSEIDHHVNIVSSGPPATISEALAYPGSKQWEAKEGCYSVCVFDARRNTMDYGTFADRAFLNSELAVTGTGLDATPQLPTGLSTTSNQYNEAIATVIPGAVVTSHPVPFMINQVIASGLSLQTTFTIEVTMIVEVAPHLNDPTYGPLTYSATPSPKEDVAALELYQRVSSMLPVGVPVRLNPHGEFWSMVRGLVSRVAPVVSAVTGLLPIPGAQIVSKMASIAGRLADVEKKADSAGEKAKSAEAKAKQAASAKK
jgi:hypothetical protein